MLFGWHTSTTRTRPSSRANGEEVKVVQELLRHANISVTLNIYAQAITQIKRTAQSLSCLLFLPCNRSIFHTGLLISPVETREVTRVPRFAKYWWLADLF